MGTAPLFVTTKLPDVERLRAAAALDCDTGLPHDANASMLLRRLKIYDFRVPAPELPRHDVISYCAHCFADFVLSRGAS